MRERRGEKRRKDGERKEKNTRRRRGEKRIKVPILGYYLGLRQKTEDKMNTLASSTV